MPYESAGSVASGLMDAPHPNVGDRYMSGGAAAANTFTMRSNCSRVMRIVYKDRLVIRRADWSLSGV